MKRIRILAALFAVLVMIIMAISFLPQDQGDSKKEETMQTVVVAKTEIPEYTVLTEEMVECMEFSEDQLPEDTIREIKDAVGKTAMTAISPKEMLLKKNLAEKGDTFGGLSMLLGEGMRAMSVKVDDVSGVSRLLRVGNRVDVITVYEEEVDIMALDETNAELILNEGSYVSTMLLQNIEIAALGTALSGVPMDEEGNPAYETVTLAIMPQDAVKLALAMHEGTVYLIQRPQEDKEHVDTVPVRLKNFIDYEE